jgi:hypothetical protein
VLLGIGWNFLFIGGTTLLTETYRAERAKVQGSNDFIVFGVQGLTSLSSGALITSEGWFRLNSLALPIVAMTALASALLWLHRRAARNLEKP